jgi:tRNA G10  N-methylase Trm11
MTGVPASEIVDLANIIATDNKLILHKDNPYIKNIMENAIKSIWYSNKDLAKKYCVSIEIIDKKFDQLKQVETFIENNFLEIYNNKDNLIKDDLKLNKDFNFPVGKKEFNKFRYNIAEEINKKEKLPINNSIYKFYKGKNLFNITGKNFSSFNPSSKEINSVNCNKIETLNITKDSSTISR